MPFKTTAQLTIVVLVFIHIFFVSCQSPSGQVPEAAGIVDEVPTATPLLPTLTLSPSPTPTAVPTETPTPLLPTSTATAEPTAQPTVAPTQTPVLLPTIIPNWPELFYLPYSFGSFGEPVLMVIDGFPQFVQPPVDDIEVFFAYLPEQGLIAYGSEFWTAAGNGVDAVTNLTVYDYRSGEATMLLEQNVGRAAWVVIETKPALAVALHNGSSYDLVLIELLEGQQTILAEDVDPYFAYAPETEQLLFAASGRLMAYDLTDQRLTEVVDMGVLSGDGWVGDAPQAGRSAAGDTFYFYPDDPFSFVFAADSAEPLVPFSSTYLDEEPLNEARPLTMLWSANLSQLIVQEDGMGQAIRIYQLSQDLAYVLDSYTLDNSELVGWYVEDDQLLLLNVDYEPQIWSLSLYQFIDPLGEENES